MAMRSGMHCAGLETTTGWPRGGVVEKEIAKHLSWDKALEKAQDEVHDNKQGCVAEVCYHFMRGWTVKVWTFQMGKDVHYADPTGNRKLVYHDECAWKPTPNTIAQPQQAGGGGYGGGGARVSNRWRDDLQCDGLPAKDRAEWLCREHGMDLHSAQERVMAENPDVFRFKPNHMCDGSPAHDRQKWLMDNKGMSSKDAALQVMKEFPACDVYQPNTMCDDHKAEDRVKWLLDNHGAENRDQAIEMVLHQFPHKF